MVLLYGIIRVDK